MQQQKFFHPGEVEVQVASGSDPLQYELWAARTIEPDFTNKEVGFVEGCTFAAGASVDDSGRPWASVLFAAGAQLFTVNSSSVVSIACPPDNGDPLLANLDDNGQLGILFFDPHIRRRAKSMGRAEILADGRIRYSLTRYFGLCPKYIHLREHEPQTTCAALTPAIASRVLSDTDRDQLGRSDTAFLASFYPDHGADVTHRGGNPGFIRVLGETRIEIPDYPGNGMFNTLGNLKMDPRLGLTDINFSSGRTLHLTGRATVSDDVDAQRHPGATRVINLEVERVVVSHAHTGIWTDQKPSPYNPPISNKLGS